MANQTPLDPYGNVIPATPGAKRVTQANGTTYPIRTNLALSGATVTDDPTGDTTTLTVTASGGGTTDYRTGMINDAATKLGVSAALLNYFFVDWHQMTSVEPAMASASKIDGYRFDLSGSAAAGPAKDAGPGGILRQQTGASSGSTITTYGPTFLPRTDTGKGYLRLRLKFETAIDANTYVAWEMANDANSYSMPIGQVGSLSTTNIIFRYASATKVDLNVTDTNWHEYVLWYVGDGKLHISVDGVEVGTGITGATHITTAAHDICELLNQGTAANRSFLCDYVFQATTIAP